MAENRRQEFIAGRDAAARAELESQDDQDIVFADGQKFRGRELALSLPRPIEIGGKTIRKAYVRQGINADVLEAMREGPTVEAPLADVADGWRSTLGLTKVETDELSAEMNFGTVSRSRIELA